MVFVNYRAYFILLVCLNFALICAYAQDQVPKICPDEPIVTAQTPCPAVCTGGCPAGVCLIDDPLTDVTCPDTLPCRVSCNGASPELPCNQISATCSKNASCDVLVSHFGSIQLAIDCNETPHSCAVYGTDDTSIWAIDCDPSKSCNCDISITVQFPRSNCTKGVDCIPDKCFDFRNESNPCLRSLRDGTMETVLENGQCSCRYPATVCTEDADCNPPHGSCSADWKNQCQCYNPYGGPRCQQHMCPHCQNSALCGNSFPGECVCTGAWAGPNCTGPLIFNVSDPIAARCAASTSPVEPPADSVAIAPVADIPCPQPCTNCSVDTDGTWVCLILETPGFVNFTCPSTHRCVLVCKEADSCVGHYYCDGNLPCDIAVLGPYSSVSFHCGSSSICRAVFGNLLNNQPRALTATVSGKMSCSYPGGACVCENNNNLYPQCNPGSDCNGDPCVGYQCPNDQFVLYNSSSSTCFCRCLPALHPTPTGCVALGTTDNCDPVCKNGGVCKNGECWCPPGFSGADCFTVQSCVTRNESWECPSSCTWCDHGVCFQHLPAPSLFPSEVVCPVGWPCVFICVGISCSAQRDTIICPIGSGPCEVWCWDSVRLASLATPNSVFEIRPLTYCSRLTLKCEDGNQRCRAKCTSLPDVSVYRQARTIRAITCGDSRVASTSSSPLGDCASECGSDSCHIAESDPCYFNYTSAPNLAEFAFFCPRDTLGKWLVPHPNNATNTCSCDCEPGLQLVNGGCVADGCDPVCQNGGVCTPSESSRYCRCFFGWTGKDCTSRCFFPISANVTSCYNGIYQISGTLTVNDTKLDLYKDVQDLVILVVDGSITTNGNSTLSIALNKNSTQTSSSGVGIQISNNLTLSGGSTLETSIIVRNGVPVAAVVNVTGTVNMQPGSRIKIFTNATEIEEILKGSPDDQIKVDLVNFGSVSGTADTDVDLGTRADDGKCSRVRATVQPNPPNGPGSLSVIFTLDDSLCSSSSVSAVAVGVGVTVAIVAAGAIVAVIAIPSVRAKVFPFLKRSSGTSGARVLEDDGGESNAIEMSPRSTNKWTAAQNHQY